MHCENPDRKRPVGRIVRREVSIRTQKSGCELDKLVWGRIVKYSEHGVETLGCIKSGNSSMS
jgi:hypothetical protein